MTFDHEAKSVATSLPEHYQPTIFTNSALQCSSVCLIDSVVFAWCNGLCISHRDGHGTL